MYVYPIITLRMILEEKSFNKVFKMICNKALYMEETDDGYIDYTLQDIGIIVIYNNPSYKKRVDILIEVSRLYQNFDNNELVEYINNVITRYFNELYSLKDFAFQEILFIKDVNVGSKNNVDAYIKTYQRMGKIKKFEVVEYENFDGNSFSLEGKCNGISFIMYDLEYMMRKQGYSNSSDFKHTIRVEIKISKLQSIRKACNIKDSSNMIKSLSYLISNIYQIFNDLFKSIIPPGRHYKQKIAISIITGRVKTDHLRKKMIKLIELLPKKKSLFLAIKNLNARDIDDIFYQFIKIDVSPITISKRHEISELESIYEYMK